MIVIPNLRHLKAFQAVARLGSVGQASISIHVSQPAVTQAIAKLESQIGAQVFDRRPSGSYLTEFGAVLLRRVDRFLSMIEESFSTLGRDDALEERRASPLAAITSTHVRAIVSTADPAIAAHAATLMGVSETALYRSARELEQIFGCRLFHATIQGLEHTPLGAELARKICLAVRELEYALDELAIAKGQAASKLAIGVLPMSASFALSAAVEDLTKRHPRIKIMIVEGTYLRMLNCLRTAEVDINFGLLRRPEGITDVVEEELFDDSFCLVVRKNHPLARMRALRPEHLAGYEWVMPAAGTRRRHAIDCLFSGSAPVTFGVETSSPSMIRALLTNSDRISVLSRHEVEFEDGFSAFSILPLKLNELSVKGITTRANWLPTSLHEEFIDLLRQYTVSAHPRHIAGPKFNGVERIQDTA